ncbi:hypothetical protein AJ80_08339 [Polytolypa hystricis UAMH7299]|uniref:Zn(2)-C6 fungal-type domain-containing protein n=1 Tax=Polytolypa hystricis (strain UAMH7299) TaxID=1447883 RepID=A0A2B7X9C5_POLH7|nr:hypothetical protein AJ80_08339 [Polytolypa hystricis UAMH7299]
MTSVSYSLDTPLLKVSRPVAACSRCRTAKIKCDGKLPACSACERAGKTSNCGGATDEFARGKERSYVASLEAQCERLEKRIEEAKKQRQNAYLTDSSPTVQEPASASTIGLGGKGHQMESSNIDDLVGDFGFLSLNATSRDFYGITSSTSFAGLLITMAIAKPVPNLNADNVLPARAQASTLVQRYFDNIYVLMPFFSETNFWSSMDAVYQDDGRFATSFDRWIVHLVLAVASASDSRVRNDGSSEDAIRYVSAALRYAEDVLHPGSIAGIQAILLLLQYSMLDPEYFRVWYSIGIAARVASDLGLHQEQPGSHYDKPTLELRRKVLHCIYLLDRYVSIAFGRAFSFSDDSVNVPYPTMIKSRRHDQPFLQSIEPAMHLLQIRNIQSQAYQGMFFNGRTPSPDALTTAWNYCEDAQNWFNNPPKDSPTYFHTLYRLELLYTFVLLLSPSNRAPTTCEINHILLFEYSLDFVSQMYHIITSSWPLFFTYVDIQRLYMVLTKFFYVIQQYHEDILLDSISDPPALPSGLQSRSFLEVRDRRDYGRRASTCLYNAEYILEYAYTRWNVRVLLDNFNRESASVRTLLSKYENASTQAPPLTIPGNLYWDPAQQVYLPPKQSC